MTKGRNVWIQKDPGKNTQVSNYCRTACLLIIGKTKLEQKIYKHLDWNKLLVNKQKRAENNHEVLKTKYLLTKKSLRTDTEDWLTCQRHGFNIRSKVYTMVLHSWIWKCLNMVGGNIKKHRIDYQQHEKLEDNADIRWQRVWTS